MFGNLKAWNSIVVYLTSWVVWRLVLFFLRLVKFINNLLFLTLFGGNKAEAVIRVSGCWICFLSEASKINFKGDLMAFQFTKAILIRNYLFLRKSLLLLVLVGCRKEIGNFWLFIVWLASALHFYEEFFK